MSRPLTEDGKLARELGITPRTVKRLGGADELRSLPYDSLKILMNAAKRSQKAPTSRRGVRRG